MGPSKAHNSRPWVPSSAEKNSVPFTLVSPPGDELSDPVRMSLTRYGSWDAA